MGTRAAKGNIFVVTNVLAGKLVDVASRADGYALTYDLATDEYIHSSVLTGASVTYETLDANGDVGTGAGQLAIGNHSHSQFAWLDQDVTSTASPSFYGLQLNTAQPAPAHSEGLAFYDTDKKAWSYYNEEADVMINTGQEVVFRIYNSSGATIPNGAVVHPEGTTVELADAYLKDKCNLIAVATHDIENESYGYVTKLGQVGGLDTSSYSVGDIIYLGTNGTYSTTRPIDGGYEVIVGVVDVVHATEGIITVDTNAAHLTVEVTDTNGFPLSEKEATTISFVDGTRTFTIAPTGADYHYYQLGEKYEKTSSDSVVIANTTGLHFIFFSGETLVDHVNPLPSEIRDAVLNEVFVSVLYWDASASVSSYLGEERHGISMSPTTHAYLHVTRGTQYIAGLNPTNILADQTGDLASHAQFGISSGNIADEDLFHDIDPVVSTTGFPIFYRSGASGIWKRVFQAGFPVYNTGSVSGRPFYNQFTGGAWQLTELTNNYYFNCHVFATNDINYPIMVFMGTSQYISTSGATDGASDELAAIISEGLPFAEFVPIATVTFQTQDNDANTVNAHVITNSLGGDFIDWRESGVTGIVGASTSATSYLDLTDTDSTYAGKANYIPQVNATEEALVLKALNTFSLSSFNDDLDVTERAQDAVGAILSNEFTYSDATPSIALNYANISHTSLQNIGSNSHSAIDTHIADATIHYTQGAISIPASQISDFDTEVSNNTDVAANTAARHSAVTAVDTSTVDLTLTGQQISASVIQSGISHLNIANKGVNTHAQIDTFISNVSAVSGAIKGNGLGVYSQASISDLSDGSNVAKLNVANVFTNAQTISSASFLPFTFNRISDTGSQSFRFANNLIGFDLLGTNSGKFEIRSLEVDPVAVRGTDLISIDWADGTTSFGTNISSGDRVNVNGSVNSSGGFKTGGIQRINSTGAFTGTTGVFTSTVTATNFIGQTAQTITYSATPTQNWTSGNNATITLTGDVTTYTLSNVPDGGKGSIRVLQDGTGGYGINAVTHAGLSTDYIDGLAPTAANINSAPAGVTYLAYERIGSFLAISYASF